MRSGIVWFILLLSNVCFSADPKIQKPEDQLSSLHEAFYAWFDLNTGSITEDLSKIEALRGHAYKEFVHELFKRMQFELEKPQKEMSSEVVIKISLILRETATSQFMELVNIADKYVKKHYWGRKNFKELNESLGELQYRMKSKRVGENHDRLPSVYNRIASDGLFVIEEMVEFESSVPHPKSWPKVKQLEPGTEFLKSRKYYQKIREALIEGVIGQPEIIDALMDIEVASKRSVRQEPASLWLTGLSDTGRKTAIDALLKAKFGKHWEKHKFEVPVLKDGESWKLLGATAGHVNASDFPPLLEFLVKHSGGKYIKKEAPQSAGEGEKYRVVRNDQWKPGRVYEGYYSPTDAYLVIDKFQDWSSGLKDDVVKPALKEGSFVINSPNGGEKSIKVPVNIIIISNEGAKLLVHRENNGQTLGRPPRYEELEIKWKDVHDEETLRRALIGGQKGRGAFLTEKERGNSEQLVSSVDEVILSRPLSPKSLEEIAEKKLLDLKASFKNLKDGFGYVDLVWDQELAKVIQEFMYIPEKNARNIKQNIKNLLEKTLNKLITDAEIPFSKTGWRFKLSFITHEDNTKSLKVEYFDTRDRNLERPKGSVIKFVKKSLAVKHPEPVSDKEIQRLRGMEQYINDRVFGVQPIAEKLVKDLVNTADGANIRANDYQFLEYEIPSARTYMFLGLSSVGKTETAKVMAEGLYGSRNDAVTISFNNVNSVESLKETIFGEEGTDRPSKFMQEFDKRQGRVLFVFDELANAGGGNPRLRIEILKALYDILDEVRITSFNDNKARYLNAITIIMTGNAGEEIYQNVPKHMNKIERWYSMSEIYQEFAKNKLAQRQLLEDKYFSQALINRVGMQNIFFFGPLNHRSVREITYAHLYKAMKALKQKSGYRGWNLYFPDRSSSEVLVEVLEQHSFRLEQQGRSIKQYMDEIFKGEIKSYLTGRVKSGSDIYIKLDRVVEAMDKGEIYLSLEEASTGKKHTIQLPGTAKDMTSNRRNKDVISTSFHETGHLINSTAYFSDVRANESIGVIPKVVSVAHDKWIVANGVHGARYEKHIQVTREYVVREMAVYLGGKVAESLVTKGARWSGGISNDIERASMYARKALLSYGLSKDLEINSVPEEVTLLQHLNSLNKKQRAIYDREYSKLFKEAEVLAKISIVLNFHDFFVPFSKYLAEKGELSEKEIKEFIKTHPIKTEFSHPNEYRQSIALENKNKLPIPFVDKQSLWTKILLKMKVKKETVHTGRDFEFISPEFNFKNVISLKTYIENLRRNQLKKVKKRDLPIRSTTLEGRTMACRSRFTGT